MLKSFIEKSMRIEHIGIAIQEATQAQTLFAKLMGVESYKSEEVVEQGVCTIFYALDNTKIELLQSLAPGSPIDKFIQKRGEGIHHIAFAVDDIRAEILRLKAQGFQFINEEPQRGADQKWICFLHPKSTHGVLVELCQDIK